MYVSFDSVHNTGNITVFTRTRALVGTLVSDTTTAVHAVTTKQ